MTSSINLIKQNYKEYFKNSIIQGSFLGFAIFSVYMVSVFNTQWKHSSFTKSSTYNVGIFYINRIFYYII